MQKRKCRHCGEVVSSNHSCNAAGRFVYHSNDDDFVLSFVDVGATRDPLTRFYVDRSFDGSMRNTSSNNDDKKSSSGGDIHVGSHSSLNDASSHDDSPADSEGPDGDGGGDGDGGD